MGKCFSLACARIIGNDIIQSSVSQTDAINCQPQLCVYWRKCGVNNKKWNEMEMLICQMENIEYETCLGMK